MLPIDIIIALMESKLQNAQKNYEIACNNNDMQAQRIWKADCMEIKRWLNTTKKYHLDTEGM